MTMRREPRQNAYILAWLSSIFYILKKYDETEAKALKEKKAMVKGFRDANVPLDIISQQTGFTIEEIKAL